MKKWGQENWQRRREYNLINTYGITSAQYEEILKGQNYSCAVCKKHESEFSKKLAVDHDHVTNEIYGLLCWPCNRILIGKIRDSKLYLEAAKYLEKGTGLFVPVKEKKRVRRRKARFKIK